MDLRLYCRVFWVYTYHSGKFADFWEEDPLFTIDFNFISRLNTNNVQIVLSRDGMARHQ